MSDADRILVAFTEEGTFGTSPAGTITAATISAVAADNSVNDSGNGFVTAGFVAGQYIDISGFTGTLANNQKARVLTVAAGKMTLETDVALVDDTAGESVTIDSALQELRITSESLRGENDSVNSVEIRDDRQVSDVVRTSARAAGDVNWELTYGTYDHLFEAAFQSAGFSTPVTITATTLSAASGDNSFNDSGSGFAVVANQWIKVSGFVTAANNGYFKIVSATTAKIIVSGGTLTTEAVGPSVTITMGAQIVNGVAQRFFTIEKTFNDLTNVFELFKGMSPNTLSLNVAAEAIITGVMGFMGKISSSESSSVGPGGNKAAPTTEVMSAVEDVTAILEALASYAVTSFTLELNNNLRERVEVATLGPISLGSGKVGATGTVQAFFDSVAQMDKFLAFTDTSMAIVIEDGAGNGYVIDMPRVKFTTGQRVAGGENTDILADLAFTAFRDDSEDITIRLARFPV